MDIKNQIRTLVDGRSDWFEQILLATAAKNLETYQMVSGSLNGGHGGGDKDLNGLNNAIYGVVSEYNEFALASGRKFSPITSQVMGVMLQARADSGKDILSEEIPQAMAIWNALEHTDTTATVAIVEAGYSYWLEKRRLERNLKSQMLMGDWTPESVYDAVTRAQNSSVMHAAAAIKSGSLGQFAWDRPEEARLPRLETDWVTFNVKLGGGFPRGDSALIFAPPHGGKTILACQLATEFAQKGYNGLFITTEQPQWQLEQRILSNFARIPFTRIDRPDWSPQTAQPSEIEAVNHFLAGVKGVLKFEEWQNFEGQSLNIVSDLRGAIDRFKKEFGVPIDFLVFDWVGGALQDLEGAGDPKVLRYIYKTAADSLAKAAGEHNMVVIMMAQAAPGTSVNKYPLNIQHLADAKNMLEKVPVGIGITTLYDQEMNQNFEGEAANMYADKQYLCIGRIRKGPGGNVPFHRHYEFQKMTPW